MYERKHACNTCIVPEPGWPRVYNMTAMDKLLLAGTMVFSSPNSDISPPLEPLVEPVDIAISWLQRETESYKRDMELLERFRIPTPVPEDDRLPPTLPFRMRGRIGVREYELQDKEDQPIRMKRLESWRNTNRAKKYKLRKNEAMERKIVESTGNDTENMARGIKRKSEDDPRCATDAALHRPKRCRIPNTRYDSAIFVLTPPSRCSQVVPSSPERRSQ